MKHMKGMLLSYDPERRPGGGFPDEPAVTGFPLRPGRSNGAGWPVTTFASMLSRGTPIAREAAMAEKSQESSTLRAEK